MRWTCVLLVFAFALSGQSPADFITPSPLPAGDVLIIGFLGGWERWDNEHRGVRRLALRLRQGAIPGVHIETIENHNRAAGLALIRRVLDADRNGILDNGERSAVRLILYGQSFGGAAVVKLARELEKLDVPVALTVQIDSVGRDDDVIPANVRHAANFFQQTRLTIRGEKNIRAADPSRTAILANDQYKYPLLLARNYPDSWLRRTFGGGHASMDADPAVWSRVEALILGAISKPTSVRVSGLQ
jgi:hypothetical protein